jgi:hypothetical protein
MDESKPLYKYKLVWLIKRTSIKFINTIYLGTPWNSPLRQGPPGASSRVFRGRRRLYAVADRLAPVCGHSVRHREKPLLLRGRRSFGPEPRIVCAPIESIGRWFTLVFGPKSEQTHFLAILLWTPCVLDLSTTDGWFKRSHRHFSKQHHKVGS